MQQQPGLILSQDPAVRVQQLQQHPEITSSSYPMMQVRPQADYKIDLPASNAFVYNSARPASETILRWQIAVVDGFLCINGASVCPYRLANLIYGQL